MRVLIVGASFGGLTLANRLLQTKVDDDDDDDTEDSMTSTKKLDGSNDTNNDNNRNIQVDIIDALRPPSADCVFVGDINVPAAKSVLKDLQSLRRISNEKDDDTFANLLRRHESEKICDIPRQRLLDWLRMPVTAIKYYHVLEEVLIRQHDNDDRRIENKASCWAKVNVGSPVNRKRGVTQRDESIEMGPYDFVVFATGTRSQFPIQYPSASFLAPNNKSKNEHVLLLTIGDARYTRWWDFGQHRIRQGANQALLDGLELGNALARSMDVQGDHAITIPTKFQISYQQPWPLWKVGFLLALVVAIVFNSHPRQ